MAEKSKTESKKMMDVAQPGTSAASPTSKSIIAPKRSLMQDPMVVAENPSITTASEPAKSPLATKINIQPLSAPVPKAEEASAETDADSTAEAPAKTSSEDTASEPASQAGAEEKPAETPDEPAIAESAESSAESSSPSEDASESDATTLPGLDKGDNADSEAADAKQSAYDENLQKLIDTKQYFLPINSAEKRRTKRLVAAGVIFSVLLAVLWVDVALDAGIIHLGGVKAVTHFFSN